MERTLSKKKSKLLSAEPVNEIKDHPKQLNIKKADNGFVVDINYGEKSKVAESIESVVKIIEDYFG